MKIVAKLFKSGTFVEYEIECSTVRFYTESKMWLEVTPNDSDDGVFVRGVEALRIQPVVSNVIDVALRKD